MVNADLNVFDKCDVNMAICRDQSYDNASNTSGVYNGIQAKVKQLNSLADYVPCSSHSLNLVGGCATVCSEERSIFILFHQKDIYIFLCFNASLAISSKCVFSSSQL